MKQKTLLIALLPVFCFSFLLIVDARGDSSGLCRACQDIQHAADLASIEKRLLEASNDSLEELDQEALDWYAKFQEGGILFDGWQQISEDVVEIVPEQTRIKTKISMLALGIKIGCEWSKDNDIRKISTEMLKNWGKQLRKTVADSPEQLPVIISCIESEVDDLLFKEFL
ncbi:MAG TPA: hypothetical protein EYP35_04965 [Desulfobacterales bacterium]|nr:hypothetical protein [Desulfobacterales bacterium]HIP40253.1 hypothetical protein [Desulfocapsa sulfexigens]